MTLRDSPVRFLQTVLFYAALGAMWNLGNVSYKKMSGENSEKLIIRKTARAVGLGAAAGVLVAIWGDEGNPGNFEVAMGVVVPLADKVWNAYENGMETYENADDGDGENFDEATMAIISAIQSLQSQNPQDPTQRPDSAANSEPKGDSTETGGSGESQESVDRMASEDLEDGDADVDAEAKRPSHPQMRPGETAEKPRRRVIDEGP